jgi:hypothetical protein
MRKLGKGEAANFYALNRCDFFSAEVRAATNLNSFFNGLFITTASLFGQYETKHDSFKLGAGIEYWL